MTCLVVAVALLTIPGLTEQAAAATFLVDTTADAHDAVAGDGTCGTGVPGSCSLRAAIEETNALASADTVTVPPGTYTLTLGQLDVSDAVIVAGAAAATTIVDAAAASRVFDVTATATISNLTLRNGYAADAFGDGGGVRTSSALTLDHVVVRGNTATFFGGGISATGPSGALVLTDSTVSGNTAQAGGGVVIESNPNIGLIQRSTIVGNTAAATSLPGSGDGGGIRSGGTVTVVNSTVTGNTAESGGGGLINFNFAHVVNSTFADNTAPSGSQLWNDEITSQFDVVNTVVSSASSPGSNCGGTHTPVLTSLGHNLDNGTSCGFTAAGDLAGVDPHLGPLAPNGGPTETIALLAGSPAIDAADDTACPPVDQRGVARPQGPHCDIGAYERLSLVQILTTVRLHIVDPRRTGACPGSARSCFLPGSGAVVRVYAVDSPAFQDAWGTSDPPRKLFPQIFAANFGSVGSCVAAGDGTCAVLVPTPGDYLVIARLATADGPVYAGHVITSADFVQSDDETDANVLLNLQQKAS